MNPMIPKEVRQVMRERRARLLPSIYLILLGGVLMVAHYFVAVEPFWLPGQAQGLEVGPSLFPAIAYTQLTLLTFIAPALSATGLTVEKEQRTLPAILTTLIRPVQVWWGKFLAAMLFQGLLLVSGLPVTALILALGGVALTTVGGAIGMTLVVLAGLTSLGLYLSSSLRRSVHATAIMYALLFVLTVCGSIGEAFHAAYEGSGSALALLRFANPFHPLSAGLFDEDAPAYEEWKSLGAFALLGGLAAILAVRNIARSGEHR